MVGHGVGPADGAEEDRIGTSDLLLPVLRHHPTVPRIIIAAGKIVPLLLDRKTKELSGALEYAHPLRHHFLADPVARDDRDRIASPPFGHWSYFQTRA